MGKSGNRRSITNSRYVNYVGSRQQISAHQRANRQTRTVMELVGIAMLANMFKSAFKALSGMLGLRSRVTRLFTRKSKWVTCINAVTGKEQQVPAHNVDYFLRHRTNRWSVKV